MFRDLADDPVNFPNRYLRDTADTPPPTPASDDAPGSRVNGKTPKTNDGHSDEKAQNVNGSSLGISPPSSQEIAAGEMTPSANGVVDGPGGVTRKNRLDSEGTGDESEHVGGTNLSRARRRLFPDDDSNDTTTAATSANDDSIDAGDLPDEFLLQASEIKTEPSGTASTTTCNAGQKTNGPSPPKKSLIRPVHTPAAPAKPAANANDGANIPLRPLCGKTHFRPRINAVMTVAKRPSYKLVDLHQRIIGFEPIDSHRAEDDCVTLARCFWLTPKATMWADHNAIPFDRFRPLYTTRRKPMPPGKFPSSC